MSHLRHCLHPRRSTPGHMCSHPPYRSPGLPPSPCLSRPHPPLRKEGAQRRSRQSAPFIFPPHALLPPRGACGGPARPPAQAWGTGDRAAGSLARRLPLQCPRNEGDVSVLKQLWPPVGLVGPLYLIFIQRTTPPSIQRAKFIQCPNPTHTREQGRKGVWRPQGEPAPGRHSGTGSAGKAGLLTRPEGREGWTR